MRGIVQNIAERHCVACGTKYTPRSRGQQYCGPACRPRTRGKLILVTPEEQRVLLDIVGRFAGVAS